MMTPLHIARRGAVPGLKNLNNFGWRGSYSIISLQNRVCHHTLGTVSSWRFSRPPPGSSKTAKIQSVQAWNFWWVLLCYCIIDLGSYEQKGAENAQVGAQVGPASEEVEEPLSLCSWMLGKV